MELVDGIVAIAPGRVGRFSLPRSAQFRRLEVRFMDDPCSSAAAGRRSPRRLIVLLAAGADGLRRRRRGQPGDVPGRRGRRRRRHQDITQRAARPADDAGPADVQDPEPRRSPRRARPSTSGPAERRPLQQLVQQTQLEVGADGGRHRQQGRHRQGRRGAAASRSRRPRTARTRSTRRSTTDTLKAAGRDGRAGARAGRGAISAPSASTTVVTRTSTSATPRTSRRTTTRTRRPVHARPRRVKVRHILVKNKALADQLYAQLKDDDSQFAALAKKYSKDPGSGAVGGDLRPSITKGQTVPAFDKDGVRIDEGIVSKPGQDAVRLPPDRGHRPGRRRDHQAARRRAQEGDQDAARRRPRRTRRVRRRGSRICKKDLDAEDDVRRGLRSRPTTTPTPTGAATTARGDDRLAERRAGRRGPRFARGTCTVAALVVALGPGEPELVPAAALAQLARRPAVQLAAGAPGWPRRWRRGRRRRSTTRRRCSARPTATRWRWPTSTARRRVPARPLLERAGRRARRRRAARADRAPAPRLPVGSRAGRALDRAAHRRGGLRGRRGGRRATGSGRS